MCSASQSGELVAFLEHPLLPTGAGEPRRVATGAFDHIVRAAGRCRRTAWRSPRSGRTGACFSTRSNPGRPVPVDGAASGDAPIRFSPDGRRLYVLVRGEGTGSEIARIEVASGERAPGRRISPEATTGVAWAPRVFLSADGGSYVYSFSSTA